MPIADESNLDTKVFDHMTGAQPIDTAGYTDVVGVRKDNFSAKESEGLEVIADSDQDMLLMGRPVAQPEKTIATFAPEPVQSNIVPDA